MLGAARDTLELNARLFLIRLADSGNSNLGSGIRVSRIFCRIFRAHRWDQVEN